MRNSRDGDIWTWRPEGDLDGVMVANPGVMKFPRGAGVEIGLSEHL